MTSHPGRLLARRRSLLALAGGLLLPPAAGGRAQAPAQPTIRTTGTLAPNLYELVFSAATDRVLVASAGTREGGSAILALDPRSLEVAGRMALPEGGFGLGLNDRTGILYVTHTRSGAISAVDVRSGGVVARMAEGERAHLREVVVDEAGDRAFASVFGAREAPSAIWVIDGAARRIARVLTEGLTGGITGLALDAPRDRLYATALTAGEIVEIDLSSGAVLRRFAAGGEGPVNVAIDRAGRRLFVTNQRSGTLSVLSAETGGVIGSVPVGEGALGVAYDAARAQVLTANRRAGTVSVVDARTLSLRATLEAGTHPNTVVVDPRGGVAFVTSKARMGGRGAPPPEDPRGDTVSRVET